MRSADDRSGRGPHRTSGPLAGMIGPALAAAVGAVATPIYSAAIHRRNRAFDAGRGVTRVDRPVVSVGNLSVGGTGKTPMVARLVESLLAAGRRPCIAMRGYKSTASRGTAESDEAAVYARAFPGLPIVAQPDRTAGLAALFATPEGHAINCVVLDDGFQHRRLARDVDIVLIDATAGTLRDRLLPAGWLREPMSSLTRAHAVVVTHAELASDDELAAILQAATGVNPRLVVATCRHSWTALISDHVEPRPVESIRGERVVAVCAIGNPGAFLTALERTGASVVGRLVLRDHAPFDEGEVVSLVREIERTKPSLVVCTEKDWSKLQRVSATLGAPVVRPRLDLTFDHGWEELWALVMASVGMGDVSYAHRG